MVTRRADWRVRLGRYLAEEERRPHEYGVSDCALFAAGAVEAMTGHDPAAAWRGKYKSKTGGLRLLKRDGFASMADVIWTVAAEVDPRGARDGDIVEVQAEDGVALGVVAGGAIAVRTPTGLGRVPVQLAQRAWRIER